MKKISSLLLVFAILLFSAVAAYADNDAEAITVTDISISVNAKHGIKFNEPEKLVEIEADGITFDRFYSKPEFNTLFYEDNTDKHTEKMYAGNQYAAAVYLEARSGYEFSDNMSVSVKGGEILNFQLVADESGYEFLAVEFTCTADGNIFQKLITFFHNLFSRFDNSDFEIMNRVGGYPLVE